MADSFKRFTVEIDFCEVNPAILSMVSNAQPYYDGSDASTANMIGVTVAEGEINKWFALIKRNGLRLISMFMKSLIKNLKYY